MFENIMLPSRPRAMYTPGISLRETPGSRLAMPAGRNAAACALVGLTTTFGDAGGAPGGAVDGAEDGSVFTGTLAICARVDAGTLAPDAMPGSPASDALAGYIPEFLRAIACVIASGTYGSGVDVKAMTFLLYGGEHNSKASR
jgi:hypothetical protein